MSEYRDLANQPINVGDIVCYAALWSRSAVLRYGRVKSLKTRKDKWKDAQNTDQLTNQLTIGVVGVDRVHKSGRNPHTLEWLFWEEWDITKKGHEITLGFLDRLLVVRPEQLPREVRDLLISDEESV